RGIAATCEEDRAMIPRYSLPRMAALWDPEHRFLVWLRIEVLPRDAWAARVGDARRYIHPGLTSSDVMDTALAFQLQEAADILLEDCDALLETLKTLARIHKQTVMVGRTHGVHAEPMTLGLKVARWYSEMLRNRERLAPGRGA